MVENKKIRSSRIARFAAYAVDASILLPVTVFLRVFKIPLLGLVVVYGYNWILISLYGQTLGKKFFGLRVVSNDEYKLGWGRVFIREVLGKIVSGIVLGIGFLWILFDKKRQGWHDMMVNTIVVQEKELRSGRKFLAYIMIFIFPILLFISIYLQIILSAINPSAQIQKVSPQQLLQQQRLYQQQFAPLR